MGAATRGPRGWLLGGALVLVLLVVAVLAVRVSTAAGEPSFTRDEPLPPYPAYGPEPIELDDGGAVSVTKDADDHFVVQWRDPDGTRWTEPEPVGLSQAGLEGDDATIDARGDTVALSLAWYAEDDDSRENNALSAAVVCRDHACDVVARDTWLSPYLSEDGRRAVVASRGDSYSEVPDGPAYALSTWRAQDDEWETLEVEAPAYDDRALRPELVMLGDGTLATVRSVLDPSGGGCRYELWATDPPSGPDDDLDAELEVVHTVEASGDSLCLVGSPTPGTPEDPTLPTALTFTSRGTDEAVTLTRADDGWEDDLPVEAAGLVPTGRDGFGMTVVDVGEAATAIGSPDGTEVVTQYRAPGETSWTRPVPLGVVESGERCRSAEAERASPGEQEGEIEYVVVAVTCWPVGSRWGSIDDGSPPPTSGFALATTDGRTWAVEELDRPAYAPEGVDQGVVVVRGGDRSVYWLPGGSRFGEIRLPLPHPSVDTLLLTGAYVVRVTGNEDADGRCRPTWATAPLGATSWRQTGDIRPVTASARDTRRCYGVASDRALTGYGGRPGREIEVAAVELGGVARIEGTLLRGRDGEGWRFRPGEDG